MLKNNTLNYTYIKAKKYTILDLSILHTIFPILTVYMAAWFCHLHTHNPLHNIRSDNVHVFNMTNNTKPAQ